MATQREKTVVYAAGVAQGIARVTFPQADVSRTAVRARGGVRAHRAARSKPALGVLAFGLAGLGCSALLPLTISFGQEELAAVSAAVAGGVIAFYQLGYGIAAFGVGPSWTAASTSPLSMRSPQSWPRRWASGRWS